MIYRDPRCVHVADSPAVAELVASWLQGQGIEARVMDQSTLGGLEGLTIWSSTGVSARGIEVWVLDPEQAPRALELLAEREAERVARRESADVGPVAAVCEECGLTTTFPGAQRGTTQQCPHCAAYLDVPGGEEEWEADQEGEPEEES